MITCLVLGSGGAVPTPDRSPAAYWLTVDGRAMLVDPGPGALVRLLRDPHGPGGLDAVETVFFTHFHPDHCADLPALLFALHGPVTRSERPLQLVGPPGLSSYLESLQDVYGSWLDPRRRPLIVDEIEPGAVLSPADDRWAPFAGDGPRIEAFAADHEETRFSKTCLLYRFADQEGCTLVYSGDSQPCAGLSAAASGADLLLVECSIPDAYDAPGHMTPSRVGRLAREAAPGRVVLTHLYPAVDALDVEALVGEHYDGPVVRARDGLLLHVPHRP